MVASGNDDKHNRPLSLTVDDQWDVWIERPSILSLRARLLSFAGSGVPGLEGCVTTERNSLDCEYWDG